MNENTYLEQKNETMGENSFMKKQLKNRLNQKGLTLIELLAVIVILAIIAAIAIPAIGGLIENSRYNAVKADAITAINASNIYFTENPNAASVSIADLVSLGYLDNSGKIDSATANATDNFVTKATGGNTITTAAITYSGSKTLTFSAASVNDINTNTQTGSSTGNKEI